MKRLVSLLILLIAVWIGSAEQSLETLKDRLPSVRGPHRVPLLNEMANLSARSAPREGLEYAREALELAEEHQDIPGRMNALKNMGILFWHLSIYDRALDHYLKALDLSRSLNDTAGTSTLLNNIGLVHDRLQNYRKAITFYRQSLELKEQLGTPRGVAITLNNMGLIYKKQGEPARALDHHRRALAIFKRISYPLGAAYALHNIGDVLVTEKKFTDAVQCFKEALEIKETVGEAWSIAYTLTGLAEAYVKLDRIEQSIPLLQRSLALSEKIGALELSKDNHRLLSRVYRARGDFRRSLEHFTHFSQTKDRIFNAESNRKIAAMQVKHELDRKSREIELLKKDRMIQEIKARRQRIMRDSLVVITLLSLILLALLFRRYRHLLFFWKKRNMVGSYQIIEKIASGGMGTVYRAHSVFDKSDMYAVKVLKDEFSNTDDLVRRFKNEALIIDQLDHPHIVKVFERGEHDGQLYMVMEYLEGITLAELIRHKAPLPISDFLTIAIQMCDVLTRIHEKSIIHRDLKPENVVLVEREDQHFFVKLLDFGIAKSRTLTQLTQSGVLMGTLLYLSPEQIRGQELTPASDIFSLGIVFHEMLTGDHPFGRDGSMATIMKRILRSEAPPINLTETGGPKELTSLLRSMLFKDPASRPTIIQVGEALLSLR